ncbi:(R)-citramalate synthase [bioreactor metagenome]|uniref:(R)-citramalate synthase n=1 Tax=bioreactor metagenome TaxID=1076179 RepID=A0A644ZF99_9ZZZZ
MNKVYLLDSTLRDGAQSVGISFSVQDKIKIARILDELQVDYIEAGNPGSNPKDMEFFELLQQNPLKHAKVTAFGATRKKNIAVENDANIKSLLSANTECVTIFGKSWDIHVTDILRAELSENLAMIRDTVRFLKAQGKEVVYDAEHFFDGYRANPDYALSTLEAAYQSGADCLCLCDTNGGSFPDYVQSVTKLVKERFPVSVGIHAHDDAGMAAANSVLAVTAGATHVQGTLAGFGERCGNANLSTVLASLQLKLGYDCVPAEALERLTSTVHEVADISNISVGKNMPYVGANAFAHKGGMHVDGVMKNSLTFEHVSPSAVGNSRRVMMSEVAGRSAILEKVKGFYPEIKKDSEEATKIIDMVKQMEHQGYQFEGAEASFELEVRKLLGVRPKFFELQMLSVVDEPQSEIRKKPSLASIKVLVGERLEITAAEGLGPVNAIDAALRKALEVFYPEIGEIRLTDYKVRVLDSESATAATVRVLIESTDGREYWTTVGVAVDIMQASTRALMDSIEYKLLKSSTVAKSIESRTESA